MLYLVLLFVSCILYVEANYLINGGFSLPALASDVPNGKFVDSWNVTWIDLKNEAPSMGFGQYVDLQKGISQNGRIEQQVTLLDHGVYELNFYQRAKTTNYSLYKAQIYWNGALVATKVANTTSITYESVMLVGQVGANVLKFQETGLDVDNHGMHIDEVSLNLVAAWINDQSVDNISNLNISANTDSPINSKTANNSSINNTNLPYLNTSVNYNNTLSSPDSNYRMLSLDDNELYYIAIGASVFFTHTVSIRYGFLLLQDLWLYSYDQITYEGVIKQVFNTTTYIQQLKFRVLDKELGWSKYYEKLPISNYDQYQSQVLLQVLFPYFIYTLPQITGICLVFYILFCILKQTILRKFLSRYKFFWINLVQSLIQGNIAYFTFVYLSHLQISFSFTFWDKASLLFSIIFYFAIFMFSALFYFSISILLRQRASYFISCYNRSMPAFSFLTFNNLIKGVLRGSIFYFLSSQYENEAIVRCLVQLLLIKVSISMEKVYKIFMSQSMFLLYISNEATFLFLNICLLCQYHSQGALRQIFIQFEGTLVYLLIAITISRIFMDLLQFQKIQKLNPKKANKASKIGEIKDKEYNYILNLKSKSSFDLKTATTRVTPKFKRIINTIMDQDKSINLNMQKDKKLNINWCEPIARSKPRKLLLVQNNSGSYLSPKIKTQKKNQDDKNSKYRQKLIWPKLDFKHQSTIVINNIPVFRIMSDSFNKFYYTIYWFSSSAISRIKIILIVAILNVMNIIIRICRLFE